MVSVDETTLRQAISIAEGANEVATSSLVTAHLELVAITAAIDVRRGAVLSGATIYAGGEPCPICSAAVVWAGIPPSSSPRQSKISPRSSAVTHVSLCDTPTS